jgi:MYXO-CTERM domain-containing protein
VQRRNSMIRGFLFVCATAVIAGTGGQAHAAEFPLALKPNTEVDELFGYAPEYTQNVPSFDAHNRAYIRNRGVDIHETSFFHVLEEGVWKERDFLEAVKAAYPDFERVHQGAGRFAERLVFDSENRAYSILTIRLEGGATRNVLLFSDDQGQSWEVHHLSNGGTFALEHFVGHNEIDGPPFLLLSRRNAGDHPDPWASYHEFYFVQPRIENGQLVVPSYTENHINDDLISLGQHSGGSSFSVTRAGKTHFVWVEVTNANVPGTPTFVATYDHATGTVGPHELIAYAPPKNNSHNRPGIVMDSEGYLHVVTGSHHGQNFYYTRSLAPNDAYGGWTDPEPVWATGWTAVSGEERGGQTYVGLVCDRDDTLHLTFRHWRNGDSLFNPAPASYYAALAYQRKPKGEPWSTPRPLVLPERGHYSNYYHKLAIDREDRLFLSLSYFDWTLDENKADPDEAYWRRMVIVSHDHGDTWKLAETEDFADPPLPEPEPDDTTGEGDDSAGDGDESGADTADTSGPGSDDGTGTTMGDESLPDADGTNDGCGCTVQPRSESLLLLVFALGGLTRSRRRRHPRTLET